MGFLTMAYGKLAAGRNYRQIQSRLVRVQRELQRTTKQIGEQQKALERQKRDAINSLTMGIQAGQQGLMAGMGLAGMGNMGAMGGMTDFSSMIMNMTGLTAEDIAGIKSGTIKDATMLTQYNEALTNSGQIYTSVNSMIQNTGTFLKTMVEDYYDSYIDQQMQPLKDLEEELTLEKENLESQAQLAKQDYEAMKEGEKSDAQMMKPNYTGSGG